MGLVVNAGVYWVTTCGPEGTRGIFTPEPIGHEILHSYPSILGLFRRESDELAISEILQETPRAISYGQGVA